jgi:S-adenosylmethionine:tRNA ribosyltransferase-isomerase
MKLDDFDYELPPASIAQEPAEVRDQARLLVHERARDATQHRRVCELGELLRPGDLLVVNDTRVLRARLYARRASGGRVELLLLAPAPPEARATHAWTALVHPAGACARASAWRSRARRCGCTSWRASSSRTAGPAWSGAVELEEAPGAPLDPLPVLERAGHVPLPPYVERPDDAHDAERYQTVYAAAPGAVAAPTAGLHFTPALLAHLAELGVERAALTLHVGPGTFQPVKSARIEEHPMHAERLVLPPETVAAVRAARARGGRVVAVGTTVVRALESRVDERGELQPGSGSTRLFLYPARASARSTRC